MQATLSTPVRAAVGPWLVNSRLSESQAATARVTWAAAERLTRLVFGVVHLFAQAYGPERLNRRTSAAPLATRYL